ncbi:hypothetical protein BDW59DRAFT_137186 [Aspergillus cavernicola]|uniref:Uncharacterized protein n=1 Tax=Aspergillus cavernicola TaxID=176166 RepID=A0ABR4J514_9EURO
MLLRVASCQLPANYGVLGSSMSIASRSSVCCATLSIQHGLGVLTGEVSIRPSTEVVLCFSRMGRQAVQLGSECSATMSRRVREEKGDCL